jgi:hypothetical protein
MRRKGIKGDYMSKETSKRVASIAAKGIKNPTSLTEAEIVSLCASVLAQKEKIKQLGEEKIDEGNV